MTSSMTSSWRNFHVCENCRAMRIAPPAVNHRSVAASSFDYLLMVFFIFRWIKIINVVLTHDCTPMIAPPKTIWCILVIEILLCTSGFSHIFLNIIVRCHAYASQRMYLLKIGFWRITPELRQTLTDLDKILQASVGRTQIPHLKILKPWAKWVQIGGEKVGVFCNGYSELAFLCITGQIGMKFQSTFLFQL